MTEALYQAFLAFVLVETGFLTIMLAMWYAS